MLLTVLEMKTDDNNGFTTRVVNFHRILLQDFRYLVAFLFVIGTIVVCTFVFSEQACAEGFDCQDTHECISCETEREECERVKNELSDLAYKAALGAIASGFLSAIGCGPCIISTASFAIIAATAHVENGKIECNDCHVPCFHCRDDDTDSTE